MDPLEVAPHVPTAEPRSRRAADAEPSTEAPPPAEAEPRAEDTFDWNATPGPAKFAAFMEAPRRQVRRAGVRADAYPPKK